MRAPYALLAAAAVFASAPAPLAAHEVAVPMDEVRTIAFDKPAATIYVGNSAIADVTMIDSRHAFVLGKQFGATNIIVLDSTGAQIGSEHVTVFGGSNATVTLQRGVNKTTYACAAARCEPTPVPGDGKDAFDTILDQVNRHQDLGAKAADAK